MHKLKPIENFVQFLNLICDLRLIMLNFVFKILIPTILSHDFTIIIANCRYLKLKNAINYVSLPTFVLTIVRTVKFMVDLGQKGGSNSTFLFI